MAAMQIDPFSARSTFDTGSGTAALYRLRSLDDAGVTNTARLPYCLRTILEALLRTPAALQFCRRADFAAKQDFTANGDFAAK